MTYGMLRLAGWVVQGSFSGEICLGSIVLRSQTASRTVTILSNLVYLNGFLHTYGFSKPCKTKDYGVLSGAYSIVPDL